MDRLARVLQRSQFDLEFHQYGNMLLWFAAIVFLTHVVKHLVVFGTESLRTMLVLLSIAQSTQFGLMLMVFWWYRRRRLMPQTVAERQLWSVWLGYVFACLLMGMILKQQFGIERLRKLVEYPHFSIMAGMAFFILGSSYWGGCYAIGVVYFLMAGLMLLEPRWSVLEYGSLWGIVLALLGWHLRRLGREREQTAEAGQTSSAEKPS